MMYNIVLVFSQHVCGELFCPGKTFSRSESKWQKVNFLALKKVECQSKQRLVLQQDRSKMCVILKKKI